MPDNLTDIAKGLADTMKRRFTPPEFIPGCKVTSVADISQYATNNGWVEAICGQHNQQRCRWRGQYASIAVDDYIDVMYFPDRRLFEVHRQGGSGALSATVAAGNITSGTATDGYVLTADGAGAADWEATGDMVGPGSATDNAVARFDGTTGKLTQNSTVTISDIGVLAVDTIAEKTSAAGVTVDGVLLKDSDVLSETGDVGLRSRLSLAYTNAGATLATIEDFNAGLPSGWSWAGAPFIEPATGVTTFSSLAICSSATAADRSFFYAPTLTTANRTISLSLSTITTGTYGGLRWDDGSDDNYVELRLQYTATNTYSVVISHRTGGGTPVTTTGWSISLPIQLIIRSAFSGTYWTSWNTWMSVYHQAVAPLTLTSGYLSGATWEPTRWGIVAGGFAATWQRVYVDWVV